MALDDVRSTTAGQVAYETYFFDMENTAPAGSLRWQALEPRVRDAWEAAAQAVLAHIPGYAVEYDENSCAWLIEQATRLRMALSHGMTLRIEQITLPAYQQQEDDAHGT